MNRRKADERMHRLALSIVKNSFYDWGWNEGDDRYIKRREKKENRWIKNNRKKSWEMRCWTCWFFFFAFWFYGFLCCCWFCKDLWLTTFNFSDLCVEKEARHEDFPIGQSMRQSTLNNGNYSRQIIPAHFCSWKKERKTNKRNKRGTELQIYLYFV